MHTKEQYILSVDQGTTSTRALIFDGAGQEVGRAQRELKQYYPCPGWVEHNPMEILGSVVGVIGEAAASCGLQLGQIEAMGITNQRETTVVWEADTGKTLGNAIVWQCRRTADACEALREQGLEPMLREKTGLKADAYFSATKLQWILGQYPDARKRAARGEILFGTIDTYLLWALSGGTIFATDYTNASRTMLFNIHTLEWDDELLALFGVPRAMLPAVYPSGHCYGRTSAAVLGREIPICGVAGDQQAALFGHLCDAEGTAKNTYGTGCFLLMNTGSRCVTSQNGLITTLAACEGARPQYALEGSVFVAGAAVQWLRDEMHLLRTAAQSETLAESMPDTGGVYLVPAFVGLGAPYWDSDARGLLCGITRGTRPEHIVRATLESIAYQVSDVLAAMRADTGIAPARLNVDGGASANNFLMQVQADILGVPVVRPAAVESTALGAAYLAGLCCGFYKTAQLTKARGEAATLFAPAISEERRREMLRGWNEAVARAR